MTLETPKRLRRFTNLAAVLDMLLERRITLVDYSKWLDVNDRVGLRAYQDALHYGFVGAACLTMAKETFHHWQVFAGDTAGVSVHFDVRRFLAMFEAETQCVMGPVEYVALDQIRSVDASDINRLPFLKRLGFIDEAEYRVIGFAVEDTVKAIHIKLDPRAVKRITLSPFVHPALVASVRTVINGMPGWEWLQVRHSRLTDSQKWQSAISNFPKRHGVIYCPWEPIDWAADLDAD